MHVEEVCCENDMKHKHVRLGQNVQLLNIESGLKNLNTGTALLLYQTFLLVLQTILSEIKLTPLSIAYSSHRGSTCKNIRNIYQ